MKTVTQRFIKFTALNTMSNEDSKSCPSTRVQLIFAYYMAKECKSMGLSDVKVDKNGYVTARLPKNAEGFSKIGFISHMDTSPDASGEGITPVITEKYDGTPIVLNGVTLSPARFPVLLNYIGQDIISSDGTTLLGADDKAGIAEILTAMEYLITHPEIEHGDISIGFTPDEEIGRGADFFDVEQFDCDFAYTVDGGKIGELEHENFNAARAKITIKGVSVHPGFAKGIMKNAALIGTKLAARLPVDETPSKTDGYDGFYHLTCFNATPSQCKMSYIIRDFDKDSFEKRKATITNIVADLNEKYDNIIELNLCDEYYNMSEKIKECMHVIDLAKRAMEECNIEPIIRPIRGGTDGARLSYMGLPCPNIFTGGHNFHGVCEFIPVQSMEKAVEVIVKIAQLGKKP
ncbi:MAG TPA: peptidase T [Lachnospiraceae bacterium]|nr:peptidase T [Lachnospiraceae bacterium]